MLFGINGRFPVFGFPRLGFASGEHRARGPESCRLLFAAAATLLVLTTVPRVKAQDLADKSHHAKELMAAGKFSEAIPIYRELTRAVPNNPGFLMDLGLALDMSGDKPEAISEYQAVLKQQPDYFPALLLLGTAYLEGGQPAKAIDPLQRALKSQPDDFHAEETLAEAMLSLNRLRDAARRFAKLSAVNPNSSKVWYGLGLCYERLAQQAFDELAKVAPASAYWLDLVAESRLQTKQDYSAFYFYHQALAKMPGMRGVHAAIASVYRDTGHDDWAAVEEQKERQLSPPDCARDKLECDFQEGKLSEIVQDPTAEADAVAYYWRTRAYNKLALDAYVKLGELPPSAESHELKAKIESERRQYEESAKEWQEALQLSPGSTYLEKQLGIALYKSGDLAGARSLFQQLLKWQPEAADLNFYLGDTLLNAQQPQAALPYLEKAVLREPSLLPASRSIGLAYLKLGAASKAIPHLKAALSIDEDGSLHYQLARAYQMAGEKELASATLKEYQQRHQVEQAENKNVEQKVALMPPE